MDLFPFFTQDQAQYHFMRLLKSNPTLQDVQAAYWAHPDVLLDNRRYSEEDSYPIHFACRNSTDEIVSFLVQEFPNGLEIVDVHGYVPLHWAAECRSGSENGLSLETFQLLVDAYPEALTCQDHENHSPLSVALLHDCRLEILKLMVEHLSHQAEELQILLHDEVHLVLNLQQMQELVKLLPEMKKLELEAYNWTADAFLFFLEHLRTNTSIEQVTSLSLPMSLLRTNLRSQQLLQKIYEESETITSLHLTVCDHDYVKEGFAGPDTALLSSLNTGLKNNKTLQDLKLNHIALPSIECLCDFIRSESAPKILHLYSIEILGLPHREAPCQDGTHVPDQYPAANNRVESLDIENPLMSNECLNMLLNQIPKLPLLARLRLSADALPFHDGRSGNKFPNTWHVTESLVAIVSNAKRLRHLNVKKPYRFKLGSVCKALKTNTTLLDFWSNYKFDETIAKVYLHTLKHNNATLRTLSPAFQYDQYPQLQYYLELNQRGRAKARNPETCLHDFIELLDKVPSSETALHHLSLRYGLLRESPGIWSREQLALQQKNYKKPRLS